MAPSYRRQPLPHRTQAGQTVIIDSGQGEVHVLNGTASLIWDLLGDWRTVDEVVAALAPQGGFDVAPGQVQSDVARFLADLVGKGLVSGSSRRSSSTAR